VLSIGDSWEEDRDLKDEIDALQDAQRVLNLDGEGEKLQSQPSGRAVVRYGDIVVKSFTGAERDWWLREKTGLQAAQAISLTPQLISSGSYWIATRYVRGIQAVKWGDSLYREMGRILAQIHTTEPSGMKTWPVTERLRSDLENPPSACPPSLLRDVASLVNDWLPMMRNDCFVHGDWIGANVLVAPDDQTRVIAIVDFEESHLGDPAEDFRYQAFAGPPSMQLPRGLEGYGRSLGNHAAERISVAAVQLCLEVFGWGDVPDHMRETSLATMQALVDGWRPGQ